MKFLPLRASLWNLQKPFSTPLLLDRICSKQSAVCLLQNGDNVNAVPGCSECRDNVPTIKSPTLLDINVNDLLQNTSHNSVSDKDICFPLSASSFQSSMEMRWMNKTSLPSSPLHCSFGRSGAFHNVRIGEMKSFRSFSSRTLVDAGQPTSWSHPELLAPEEIAPGISAREFSDRRDAVMDRLPPGSLLVVGSANVKYMAGIIPYPYRQDADYLYLTGCQQPGGVAVLEKRGSNGGAKLTMFMPSASRDVEIWNGHLAGVDAALTFFGADVAYPIQAMEKEFGDMLNRAKHVYYDKTSSSYLHSRIKQLSVLVLEDRVRCPRHFLHHLRWKKSEAEIRLLRKSCAITSKAILSSMKASIVSPNESHVAAVMEYECRRNGAQRMSFPSVVASGANACTIHYSRNDRQVTEGDLILLDAGCEYYGYASDVTRVWPPFGKFSNAQRDVYQEVLGVLKECISMCQPGVTLRHIHQQSVALLSKSILRLGLTDDDLNRITQYKYREFYPTSVGHWLGMDTHDCANVSLSEPLKPGVVLTLEPGLYIQASKGSSQRYSGIGVRIEDDILITEDGHEVLTASVPKEVDEIEALMKRIDHD